MPHELSTTPEVEATNMGPLFLELDTKSCWSFLRSVRGPSSYVDPWMPLKKIICISQQITGKCVVVHFEIRISFANHEWCTHIDKRKINARRTKFQPNVLRRIVYLKTIGRKFKIDRTFLSHNQIIGAMKDSLFVSRVSASFKSSFVSFQARSIISSFGNPMTLLSRFLSQSIESLSMHSLY